MMLILVRIGALLLAFFEVGIQGAFLVRKPARVEQERATIFFNQPFGIVNYDALSQKFFDCQCYDHCSDSDY
jgi:hypothetical protein